MRDVLEDLLVRHGYAESKLHASAGATALLPFTWDNRVAAPMAQVGTADDEYGGRGISGAAGIEAGCDQRLKVNPPTIEPRLESTCSQSDTDGVYFGGAYTLRCYGVGSEVSGVHTRCDIMHCRLDPER